MELRILALGNGGARIAQAFDYYSEKTYYINTHKNEMDLFEGDYYEDHIDYDVKSGLEPIKLCVGDGDGTGRSPKVGDMFANKNKEDIDAFVHHSFAGYDGIVLVAIGGGGGSGTGLAPVVCQLLEVHNIKFGVIYTLPLKSEGSPTIPNAINGLNNLVRSLKGSRVAPFFIIDNQLMYEEEKLPANYWEAINERISTIMMFNDLSESEMTDISTFNTLDERELKRIFRLVKPNEVGFADIKSFELDHKDITESFKVGMKETSLGTVKGYDYRSASGLLVVVEKSVNADEKVSKAIDEFFDLLSRRFKGKRMLKSVVSTDSKTCTANILFTGMNLPSRVDRLNKEATKLVERGNKKVLAKTKVSSVKGWDDEFEDF